jgi:hypothetical protein
MPRVKAPAGTDAVGDPNKLARKQAGTYQTTDERFEVRQAALGWFLIDSTATDELGQELVRGPFPTLNAVREALPDARRTTLKPLPRPKGGASQSKAKPKPAPAPAPATWIDRLSEAEATAARSLIHALELEGLPHAQQLVKDARKDREPRVARRVLEARLKTIIDDLPDDERDIARHVMQRVLELLTQTGTNLFEPLPGWALVELGGEPGPPNRRIVLRGPPKRSR